MKARLRIIVAASFCLLFAGAPALAQEAPRNDSASAANEVIGPPQLKDFSLNGTVTREAPQPAPVQAQPAQRQPGAARTPSQPLAGSAGSATAARDRPEPSREAAAEPATPAPSLEAGSGSTSLFPQIAPAPPAAQTATPDIPDADSGGQGPVPMLPWIVAAVALAAAAGWFVLRARTRRSYAAAGSAERFDSLVAEREAAPAEPAAPAPATAPAPQPHPTRVPAGIVSTRLRPWIEIEFTPERGIVDNEKAEIAFELSLFNSGNAPARQVRVEASLFNAGAVQDRQIRLFFDNAVTEGESIPFIPPLQRITVNSVVTLPRDQLQPIVIEGRTLFVPVVAFNALYGWGSARGQTSATYIVGKETGGEKLAPFRLDLGPRVFRNLEAREHSLKVRN